MEVLDTLNSWTRQDVLCNHNALEVLANAAGKWTNARYKIWTR